MPDLKNFMIEDAQLIFRNFSGHESQFNKAGDKNFCVILTPDVAKKMAKDGWPVKTLKPREVEEGEEVQPGDPYIQVKVSYKQRPPRVVMITSAGRTNLNNDSIEVLDWADIRTCDLIANGYDWEVGDKSGTKPYLKSLFVTIEEDELERKYAILEGE